VENYKNEQKNAPEPTWSQEGTPAKVSLTASQTIIPSCKGTDDAQLLVRILDANDQHISNSLPVTLTIVSGPGEFPTGRTITFTPQTETNYKVASSDEKCDIRIMDGQAAIAFRSYHAGETIIKATSEGLEPTTISIHTLGTPEWREGIDTPVADRPYRRYNKELTKKNQFAMTLADQRPTWTSSEAKGHEKTKANDGQPTTSWKPSNNNSSPWWMVSLEAQYTVSHIEITFPTDDAYQYVVEVAQTNGNWTQVIDQSKSTSTEKKRQAIGLFGENISYVRIKFTSKIA
ncbi:MAG: discoidin domain-containing protein, partial [Bacteroidaceae bacterium]|nr:discoidin domain-containing protein [Bacteroidaceae bacterium]